ncbi:MAG TPA: pitrilysin family protein [bacterium]
MHSPLRALALLAVLAGCAVRPPGVPPPAAAEHPAPVADRRVLTDGAVLLTLPRPHLPMVSVQVEVAAGSAYDPPDLPGLASLTAALLDEGTATRSAAEIAEALEFIGASLSINCDQDNVTLSLQVLERELATGLDLLADVLTHPAFRLDDVERIRAQSRAALLAEEEEPDRIASKAFRRAAYGDHPYGHPVDGDLDSLAQIQADDLRRFHSRFFRPEATVIAVVGAITPEDAATALTARLDDWSAAAGAPSPIPPPPPTASSRVTLQRDFTQSTLILGHAGLRRDAPDFFPALVMNHILGGGGFGSRLTTDLREERGLVYGVASGFDIAQERGLFTVQLATKNESAAEAEAAVREQLRHMRDGGVTERELDEAQAYLTGSFPLRLDANGKLASYLLFMERHHLGRDYLQRFPALVDAVTRDQVAAAARHYLDPDGLIVVVVGGKG